MYAFFGGAAVTNSYKLGFLGGSISAVDSVTDDAIALTCFNSMLTLFQAFRAATDGQTSWDGAFRVYDELLDYDLHALVIDHAANNLDTDVYKYQLEGQIRRIRTLYPNTKIVMVVHGRYLDPATNNHTEERPNVTAFMRTLATAYDLELVDCADLVTNSPLNMSTWYTAPDGVHPDDDGEVIMGALVAAALTPGFLASTQYSGSLPSRIHDEAVNYEGAPIERTGVANDGETGTWTTVSTTYRQSVNAGDTLQYSGTFSSWGFESGGSGTLEWQIDGGGWTSINLGTRNAQPYLVSDHLGTSAAHTVVFRVVSGTCQIRRFLAT